MAARVRPSLLSPLERPLLTWLAARLPGAVTPDALTLLGLAGAFVSLAGYLLARQAPVFLWLASLGLVINWFGDSLDGSLARYRRCERPRYGFFVDHATDLFSQLCIGLGLALCGLIRPEAAGLALIAYLIAVAATMIAHAATGEMEQSVAGIGPTEVRLGIIALNGWLYWAPPPPWAAGLSLLDMALLGFSALAICAVALRALSLARMLRPMDGGGQ